MSSSCANWNRLCGETPRTILITGAAGLGKTHLLGELTSQAAGFRVLKGRARELDEGLAYAPLVDALESLGREPRAQQRLWELYDAVDRVALGHPSGHPVVAPGALAAQLLAELPGRTLLAIDDVHHADADTIRLLKSLPRGCPGLAIVMTGRRPPALDVDMAVTLEPLSRAEVGDLIASLLDRAPSDSMLDRVLADSRRQPVVRAGGGARARAGRRGPLSRPGRPPGRDPEPHLPARQGGPRPGAGAGHAGPHPRHHRDRHPGHAGGGGRARRPRRPRRRTRPGRPGARRGAGRHRRRLRLRPPAGGRGAARRPQRRGTPPPARPHRRHVAAAGPQRRPQGPRMGHPHGGGRRPRRGPHGDAEGRRGDPLDRPAVGRPLVRPGRRDHRGQGPSCWRCRRCPTGRARARPWRSTPRSGRSRCCPRAAATPGPPTSPSAPPTPWAGTTSRSPSWPSSCPAPTTRPRCWPSGRCCWPSCTARSRTPPAARGRACRAARRRTASSRPGRWPCGALVEGDWPQTERAVSFLLTFAAAMPPGARLAALESAAHVLATGGELARPLKLLEEAEQIHRGLGWHDIAGQNARTTRRGPPPERRLGTGPGRHPRLGRAADRGRPAGEPRAAAQRRGRHPARPGPLRRGAGDPGRPAPGERDPGGPAPHVQRAAVPRHRRPRRLVAVDRAGQGHRGPRGAPPGRWRWR